jgi:hypothetical protein
VTQLGLDEHEQMAKVQTTGAARRMDKAYDARGKTIISSQALLLPAGDTRTIQQTACDGVF